MCINIYLKLPGNPSRSVIISAQSAWISITSSHPSDWGLDFWDQSLSLQPLIPSGTRKAGEESQGWREEQQLQHFESPQVAAFQHFPS